MGELTILVGSWQNAEPLYADYACVGAQRQMHDHNSVTLNYLAIARLEAWVYPVDTPWCKRNLHLPKVNRDEHGTKMIF